MAAPHVTEAAALYRAMCSDATSAEVMTTISAISTSHLRMHRLTEVLGDTLQVIEIHSKNHCYPGALSHRKCSPT